jgi:hypothetical protein
MVVDAGWYPVHVDSVTEEINKKGDAQNIIVDVTLVTSGDEEKDKFAGVSVRHWFSEKAPGMAQGFITACGGTIDAETGGEFELGNAVGKTIEAFIKPRQFEGRALNSMTQFRPLGGEQEG